MTRSTPLARRRTSLLSLLAVLAVLAGLAALSACSAGRITQTDTQVASVPGVSADSADGKIAIRNAVLAYAPNYPAGAAIPIDLRLFNNSGQTVRLTGANTVDSDGTVVLVGGPTPSPAGLTTSPSPAAASPSAASPSLSQKANGSGSASAPAIASPSAAPTPRSTGSTKIDLSLPPDGPQVLAPGVAGPYLAVTGRSKELLAGESVGVTLTFTYPDGSTTTAVLDIPVTTPLSPVPRATPPEH